MQILFSMLQLKNKYLVVNSFQLNNVLGTENVLTATIKCGIKRVVYLQADKAAYLVNAMESVKNDEKSNRSEKQDSRFR